jgi:pimeloyl-ACP methyl ester carboxylesterase
MVRKKRGAKAEDPAMGASASGPAPGSDRGLGPPSKRSDESPLKTATYVLIHGAGDVGWYWHLVEAELRRRGHDVVTMDLPVDDDTAGLSAYADAVVDAIGDRDNLIVVAQSFGGYVAPIVCDRVPAKLMVLIAAMVPAPGETADDMFTKTRYAPTKLDDSSDLAVFYHDVAPALAAEAISKARRQSETPGKEPWPLASWPDVPTRFLLCRKDRIFPAAWLRKVVWDRLGIIPDEIDSGHTPALSRPGELVEFLEVYRADALGSMARQKPTSVDEYLATLLAPQRAALQKIRKTITAAVPDHEEIKKSPDHQLDY